MGRLAAALVLLLLVGPVPIARADAQSGSAPAAAAGAYRLKPGDAVRLAVQDEPAFAGELPVLLDGTVLFPLIGLVPVGGRPFADVIEAVRAAYAVELREVAIVLQPLVRVRILGEVRMPGLYLVDASFDVEDVLARAGGLLPTAASRRVTLIRDGRALRIDARSGQSDRYGVVQPGDEFVVPRRGWIGESVPLLIGAATSIVAAALTALLVR